jgi:chromosome segregation ATPase
MTTDPTEERISGLEDRIAELQEQLVETRQQLTDAQLDQWKGRIDELEVQMHLGRMEAEDQMEPMIEQLRNRWLDAREQLGQAGSMAGDVFGTLRSGMEQAMDQLLDGMRTARGAAKDRLSD